MNKIRMFEILIVMEILLTGCSFLSSKVSSARFTVKLPQKTSGFSLKSLIKQEAISARTSDFDLWGLNQQSSLEETDCYAIYIQSNDMDAGSCLTKGAESVLPISRFHGLYKAGETIQLDVAPGKNRTIGVISFLSANGTCDKAIDPQFLSKNYSQPLLVGSKTQDLASGENEVVISISMTNATALKSCQGTAFASLPGASWPPCPTKFENVVYENGELRVTGQCLQHTNEISMIDTTNTVTSTMSILSKSSSEVRLRPASSNLQIQAKALYRLLFKDAFGQGFEVPFTLSLTNTLTFPFLKDSSGNFIGDIIPSGGTMGGGGSYFPVLTTAGELLNYYSMGGGYQTNKLYLLPGFLAIGSSLEAIPFKQLAQNGTLPYLNSYVSFTQSDCTGDIVVYASSPDLKVRGNVVVQPKGCTKATNAQGSEIWSCTAWDYSKLTGAPTYQSSIQIHSSLNQGWGPDMAANGTFSYCYSYSGPSTVSGFVFSESQKVPFSVGDPSTTLQNTTIQFR